jgi:hypothetical protein
MNFNGLLSNRERPVEGDKKSSLQLLNRELNFEIPKMYNEWNIVRIILSRNPISLTSNIQHFHYNCGRIFNSNHVPFNEIRINLGQ